MARPKSEKKDRLSARRYTEKLDRRSSHRLIFERAMDTYPGRVVDVGCASGFLAKSLTDAGWRVTGIEPDPMAAKQAHQHCAEMFETDVEGFSWESTQKFDLIIFGDVLEHLGDPKTVLRNSLQALNSGGRVIISVPNIANITVRASLLFGKFDYTDRGILDRTHLHFYTWKSARLLVEAAGLRIHSFQTTTMPLELVIPRQLRWALPAASLLLEKCTDLMPRLFGYQFVITASTDEKSQGKMAQSAKHL